MDPKLTQETLAMIKAAFADTGARDNLAKTVTTSTGLVPYDLQAPSKNLYPVATPLRNVIPRVSGGVGLATHWVSITSITGSGYDSMGWVPEGQRSARMSYTGTPVAASYVTLGEEDTFTFEAISAGRTFEDVWSTGVMRVLQKMMLKEENAILGGNASVALGTPTAPTVSSASTGGSIAAGTYLVQVVALTYEGYRNFLASGVTSLTAIATSKSVTGADGQSYTLSGGSSNTSTSTSTGALSGSTNTISAYTPAISGAVAYAWFVGTSGNVLLQTVTTINSVALTSLVTSARQNITTVTADNSKNTLAFNGLIYSAVNSGNAYLATQATGTNGVGTPLTSSGRGSVVEIDTMLQTMWNNYQVSPTVLYMNAQEINNVTTKVLSNASGPLLRYNNESGSPYGIVANGMVEAYFNPFALDGGIKIPVKIHPYLPPGTIIGWSDRLPMQYQNNNTPNVAEVKTRVDYYGIDWPVTTRSRDYGVYAEEVLAVYAPFALGMISNIGNG